MKKTLLLTTLLLSSTSYANIYVKGGLSFTPTKTTYDRRQNQYSSSGNIEETKIDDQGVGFNLGFGYNFTDYFSVELDLEKDGISMSYGLGLNVRFYNTNKFNFYTTLGIANTMYDDEILSNDETGGFNYKYEMIESEATKFSLGLGVEYNINEKYSVYTLLERVEYGDIRSKYSPSFASGDEIDVSIAPNNKISVGAKYKF